MIDSMRPIMTLGELAAAFRAAGAGRDVNTLALGIQQGVFPFGVAIQCRGEYSYLIWRKKVEEYLNDCTGGVDNG